MPRTMMHKEILKERFGCCSAEHVMPPHGYWWNTTTLSAGSETQQRKKGSTSELLVYIAEMSEVPLGSINAEC